MLDESEVQENKWTPAICEIEWRIENFCFAVRTDEYHILSEDFILRGYDKFTKWRMELVVKNDISFVLKRLPDDGPDFILLNWQVSLMAGKKRFEPITFTPNDFAVEKNSEGSITLKPVTEVLQYLPPFEDDTIIIQCLLMVVKDEEPTFLSESPSYSMYRLSCDLKHLKELDDYFPADVILRVGQKDIKAHKAIVCRNKVLENYIEKAENGVVELPDLDYEAVDKFVNFLYSGNIDDILYEPSIFMVKCLIHFDKQLLKCYFVVEELKMLTRIKVKTHDFHWIVQDFGTKGRTDVSSLPIRTFDMDTTWTISVSLQQKRNRPNDDQIFLFADIIAGQRPDYLCLELAIRNVTGDVFIPKRLMKFNGCGHNPVFKTIIKKCDLNPSFNIHENLIVLFKIRTSEDTQERLIESRNLDFPSTTPKSS